MPQGAVNVESLYIVQCGVVFISTQSLLLDSDILFCAAV